MRVFEIPKYALKKAQQLGASDVVVAAGRSNSQQIKFVNNEIAITKNWQDESAGVFLVYKKRIVSANIKKFTKQEVDKTLKRLIGVAKLLPPKEDYFGIAKGPFRYKNVEGLFDRKLINFDKGVDYVQAAINVAVKQGAKRVSGVFDTTFDDSYTVSSGGLDKQDKGTGISISVRALVSPESSGHKIINSNVLAGFNPEKPAIEAGKLAVQSLNPQHIKPGKYDVLFYPLPLSDLLGMVAGACSIDSFESGISFFNKLNQKVGSDKLTIYDWANMPHGIESSVFDEEGTPSQKTPLIVKGTFKNYLHNYSTAQKYKTKTTGSAGLVSPSPSNTYVVPGKTNVNAMIQNMKKGLIITNTWYTTFQNYQTGDFSTIPRDAIFYVENGKIKHPVKDIRITENMINILKSISDIGKVPEQVVSWFSGQPPGFSNNIVTPAILCKRLNITKSKN
jgi:PmbA protein